jgi:hypothetical protein
MEIMVLYVDLPGKGNKKGIEDSAKRNETFSKESKLRSEEFRGRNKAHHEPKVKSDENIRSRNPNVSSEQRAHQDFAKHAHIVYGGSEEKHFERAQVSGTVIEQLQAKNLAKGTSQMTKSEVAQADKIVQYHSSWAFSSMQDFQEHISMITKWRKSSQQKSADGFGKA